MKIEVYDYYDAPKKYQVSTNGGDEDWVIVAEKEDEYTAEQIADALVACDKDRHEIGGKVVFITCHA